ncbi:MAG: Ni/Fe-hydrogenase, b-type cytochrome subunit [Nitrospinae bacterium]|nr:Ni/Fe-hydrogenase, b-type cytochrome subunit [Nitrospinota bacterium]
MTLYLEMIKTKSGTIRFLHWSVFFSTVFLVITGFYIADPVLLFGQGEAYQAFVMAKVRFIHFISAIILDVSFLVRLYLAFFSTFHADWNEVIPTPKNFKEAIEESRYYWTFKGTLKEYRWVDPMDGIHFFGLHLVLVLQLFTGFAIYVSGIELTTGIMGLWATTLHIATDWTLWAFGGLPGVRLVHHVTMWLVVVGAFIHIYTQIWKTIKLKRSDMSSIIGGYKLKARGIDK